MSLDNNIRSFDDLLQAARLQPLPQRLLFVFTSRGIADKPNPAQKTRYEQGTGGELTPVLCVDKRPEQLHDFETLIEKSRHTGQDWDIVFAGAMEDHSPWLPENEDVDKTLKQMMAMIRAGTIGPLLAFDRQGDPIMFEAA